MSRVYGLTATHCACTGQHHFLSVLRALQMVRALLKIRSSQSVVRNLGSRLRVRTQFSPAPEIYSVHCEPYGTSRMVAVKTPKIIMIFIIIFQRPVAFKYSLHSIITVFNATFSTSVFTLVQHVSATLGHHQALLLSLLKLSHCNLAFIYAHLFICLMLCFTFVFL
jgi:hypothetical protein